MLRIVLKAGREKSLLRRHPWIFSGAIAKEEESSPSGETVDVFSSDGVWRCRGAYSPASQIRVRAWTFDPDEEIGPKFFHARLAQSVEARPASLRALSAACRLVHGEADGLPGVIVDRYGDFLVCQFLTAGAERWRREIVSALSALIPAEGIYERSDVEARKKEGLEFRTGVLAGQEPPAWIEILEPPCRFLVDVRHGHKTGFYLDQRENRARLSEYASGAEILNCFSYTGGFAVAALLGGAAHAVNIESSAPALEVARRHAALNGIAESRMDNTEGDVFTVLRKYRDSGRQFDLIVLDPPKFIESRAQMTRGTRGYKDINLLAFKLLRPGGILFTFSCSGLVDRALFEKIIAGAALDAGRDTRVLRRLDQPPDHPSALHFPEGGYLKGLVCRI